MHPEVAQLSCERSVHRYRLRRFLGGLNDDGSVERTPGTPSDLVVEQMQHVFVVVSTQLGRAGVVVAAR